MAKFKVYPHPQLNESDVKVVITDNDETPVELPLAADQQQAAPFKVSTRIIGQANCQDMKLCVSLRDVGAALHIGEIKRVPFNQEGVAETNFIVVTPSECSKNVVLTVRVIAESEDTNNGFLKRRILFENSCNILQSGPEYYSPFKLEALDNSMVPWFLEFNGDLDSRMDAVDCPIVLVLNQSHALVKSCLGGKTASDRKREAALRRQAMTDGLVDLIAEIADYFEAGANYQQGSLGEYVLKFLFKDDGLPRWPWVGKRGVDYLKCDMRRRMRDDLAKYAAAILDEGAVA